MDANGQRFFLLADRADFVEAEDVAYDARKRRLRLASARRGPAPLPIDEETAPALLEHVPGALDAYGTFAWWDEKEGVVLAAGALEEPDERERRRAKHGAPVPFFPPIGEPPLATPPTDVCLGSDGVVAIALDGVVKLVDTRDRFLPVDVPFDAGFHAWRLAAAKGHGFVALDRTTNALARLTGAPAPARAPREIAPGVARPCRENPHPPTWHMLPSPAWAAGEAPVAVAMAPNGDVIVLSWTADGDARVRVLPEGGTTWSAPHRLTAGLAPDGTTSAARWATSLAFAGADRLAVLVPGLFVAPAPEPPPRGAPPPPPAEALVFAWPLAPRATASADVPELLPLGDFYPLTDPAGAALTVDRARPLFRGASGEVGYATSAGPRALLPLSKRSTPLAGRAVCRVLDSHAARTTWHRIYVEATIPDATGVRLWLAASDGAEVPADDAFFPHDLGFVPEPVAGVRAGDVPRAAFVHAPSEIPFEESLLGCAPVAPHTGLFTVLVQRAGRAVRALSGRRLHVKVELFGTGTRTPEIAAIRVYSPRFSYVDEYLPELYAETVFGRDGDSKEKATGADFLGRLLAIVESELTPMEDRVAGAYLLTDPRKTPDEALAWLASWVGLALDPALPADRQRALLQVAPELSRRHGTLRGLGLALDAVTGGDVAAGKIVLVEDWRMRRVFATILGAHLEEENDPLLPDGLIVSGNSYVGDTLFLGEGTPQELTELAALYRADPEDEAAEEERGDDRADPLDPFYERFAHRVTVLVHDELPAQKRGWIERAVALETPAHVEVRVVKARWPFLTGVASLVGIDSYLAPKRGLETFRLDRSRLGEKDVIQRPPSLDPRLEGSKAEDET